MSGFVVDEKAHEIECGKREARLQLFDFAKSPSLEKAMAIMGTGALGFYQECTKVSVNDETEEGKAILALSRQEVGRLYALFNVWTESQIQPSPHTLGQLEVLRLLSGHHDLATRTAATSVLLGESLLRREDFTISPFQRNRRR